MNKFQNSNRKGGKRTRNERRVATVARVRADENDNLLQIVLELESFSGTDLSCAIVMIWYDADLSSAIKYSIEMCENVSRGNDELPDLKYIEGDDVLLDAQDVKCLLLIVSKFNRFFGSNLYVEIPDNMRDSSDQEGGSNE